jgi:predicted phosphodiesterase
VNAPGLGGQLLMNPGSPTERRGQPAHTMGVLVVDDGLLREHRIVALD